MKMNKKELQKKTNKEFLEIIKYESGSYVNHDFIYWLLKHNFIKQNIINWYMVLYYYPIELKKTISNKYPKGNKQQAIWAVEEKTPLCETSIKTIVGKRTSYFKENKIKFP